MSNYIYQNIQLHISKYPVTFIKIAYLNLYELLENFSYKITLLTFSLETNPYEPLLVN